MKIITPENLIDLIGKIGMNEFFIQLMDAIEKDFKNWELFHKSIRHATYSPSGVIELMPCSDDEYYSFKYVNGHPGNAAHGKLTVAAVGFLCDVKTGYPILFSEMTMLTAFRTAATAAIASKYLARGDSSHAALIGTGAQSEFQVIALKNIFQLKSVSFFDIDRNAMKKFQKNMEGEFQTIRPCGSIEDAVRDADIIITATADKKHNRLFDASSVKPGTHINAVGGDCPGKTELDSGLLKKAKIVVEYAKQTLLEGEIQLQGEHIIHAELWEIITGKKTGRLDDREITIFDSVGFALEDFSALKLLYELSGKFSFANEIEMIPTPENPKDLYGLFADKK